MSPPPGPPCTGARASLDSNYKPVETTHHLKYPTDKRSHDPETTVSKQQQQQQQTANSSAQRGGSSRNVSDFKASEGTRRRRHSSDSSTGAGGGEGRGGALASVTSHVLLKGEGAGLQSLTCPLQVFEPEPSGRGRADVAAAPGGLWGEGLPRLAYGPVSTRADTCAVGSQSDKLKGRPVGGVGPGLQEPAAGKQSGMERRVSRPYRLRPAAARGVTPGAAGALQGAASGPASTPRPC